MQLKIYSKQTDFNIILTIATCVLAVMAMLTFLQTGLEFNIKSNPEVYIAVLIGLLVFYLVVQKLFLRQN